jgi:multidrug transporter EmrE-like cation transporter
MGERGGSSLCGKSQVGRVGDDGAVNSTSLFLILTGVLLNAAAQLLLKAGVCELGVIQLKWSSLVAAGWRLALQPSILGGLSCYAVSVVVWLLALSRVDVSVAYPMLSIGYVVNAFAAWALFGEAMTPPRVVGIGVIIVGVYLVSRG